MIPGGTTPFSPRMLLKVVFYAYMNNIYSCRKIERLLQMLQNGFATSSFF